MSITQALVKNEIQTISYL